MSYKIIYESRDKFTMIPNVIDDMGLTVYEFRLYFHIRRVAGEGGECWQSTETLAKSCNMSTGSVSKAKTSLEERQLIKVDRIDPKDGTYPYHLITIADIWQMNLDFYSNPSPHEGNPSPGETKNNPIKNNPVYNTRRTRIASEQDMKAQSLIQSFKEASGLKTKDPVSTRDYKEYNVLWKSPAKRILGWVDGDIDKAKVLVSEAVRRMRHDRLTIANMKSIEKVAADEYGKRNS